MGSLNSMPMSGSTLDNATNVPLLAPRQLTFPLALWMEGQNRDNHVASLALHGKGTKISSIIEGAHLQTGLFMSAKNDNKLLAHAHAG